MKCEKCDIKEDCWNYQAILFGNLHKKYIEQVKCEKCDIKEDCWNYQAVLFGNLHKKYIENCKQYKEVDVE